MPDPLAHRAADFIALPKARGGGFVRIDRTRVAAIIDADDTAGASIVFLAQTGHPPLGVEGDAAAVVRALFGEEPPPAITIARAQPTNGKPLPFIRPPGAGPT